MTHRKPTQKDVAEAANVSQGLVSLILSNAAVEVTESTRQRVIETAARLGYSPRARSVTTTARKPPSSQKKQQKTIAYISPAHRPDPHQPPSIFEAYDEFYGKVQNCLVEAAFQKRCSLIVRPGDNITELTGWLIEWGVDGVILHSNDENLATWIARRYPLVQLNRRLTGEADVVMPNQEELMLLALSHLRQHGHQRIAFATRPSGDSVLATRIRVYRDFAQREKLPVYEKYLSCTSGEEIISNYFSTPASDRPTALIAGDPSALFFQREARRRGISLPEEISVVGIDNISADVFADPPLTSIDIQTDEIARTALRLILERIKEPASAFQKVEITPRLVQRESVSSLAPTSPSTSPTLTL